MARLILPPSPPGKLGWEGQSAQTVTKGGLTVVPGQSLVGRTIGGRLHLDSAFSDAAETFSLYVPGQTTVAETLGNWSNYRLRSKSVYVSSLEANYRTAPSGGDAANHFALRATDGTTTLTLPISLAGVRHYALDRGAGTEIVAPRRTDSGGTVTVTTVRSAIMRAFTPTQNIVTTGIKFWAGVYRSAAYQTGTLRGHLLDSAGNIIASGSVAVSGIGAVSIPFTFAVRLVQGTTYYWAVDCWGTVGETLADTGVPLRLNGTAQAGQPVTEGAGFYMDNRIAPGGNTDSPTVRSYTTAIAGGDSRWNNSPQYDFSWALLGYPSTGVLTGDIALTIAVVGAPPALSGGTDLNVRAVFLS